MAALSSWPAILLLLAALAPGGPAAPAPELVVDRLLDQYAAGNTNEAMAAVAGATREQARGLRNQLWLRGVRWVTAVPDQRRQRLLTAASFALESEIARAERGDWPMYPQADCAGRCVLEWARSLLLMRGDPDDAERTWWLASVAFLEGVRDWRFLHTPADPQNPFGLASGHIAHGLDRFPGESRLRLAQTFAVGNRFLVVTESAPRGPLPGAGPEFQRFSTLVTGVGTVVYTNAPAGSRQLRQVVAIRESVEAALAALAEDAVVGPEARVRLGYLHWTGGQDDLARIQLRAAAGAASADTDVRYLARFLLGAVAQSRGDADTARVEFDAALAARPDSQSAALALAALQFQQGDIDRADEVVRASLKRPSSDDPWRQFLYGGYRTLPGLIAQLRQQVRQ